MRKKRSLSVASLLVSCLIGACQNNSAESITENELTVVIDANQITSRNVNTKLGLNLNCGIDSDKNRQAEARPLVDALYEIGPKHLRFPGGAKTQNYAWAAPPFENASTHYWVPNSWYDEAAKNTLNFDEFMEICRETGAEPHVNVAVNPSAGLNEEVAAAWVKYANLTKGYNVKYWEIDNELWNERKHNFTTATLAEVVKKYSSAMKAIDPTIKIGASWKPAQALVDATGAALDFLTVSDYSGNNFTTYTSYELKEDVNLSEVPTSLSKKIVVSEFGPLLFDGEPGAEADYASNNPNNIGRGILTFDHAGQILLNDNIEYACFWNTRWFDEGSLASDALDDFNNLRATGIALSIWGKFLEIDMVSAESNSSSVVSYASIDQSTRELSIFLVNKTETKQLVNIEVKSAYTYAQSVEIWRYEGTSSNDTSPSFTSGPAVEVSDNIIVNFSLPITSITVIALAAN